MRSLCRREEYYFKFNLLCDFQIKCGKILLEIFLFSDAIYLALQLRLHTYLQTRILLR